MDAFRQNTIFVTKYLFAEVTKRPRNYLLGLSSVVLITFFIAVILLGVTKSPVVFLRLVEITASEMDTVILSNAVQGLPFVNHTEVLRRLDGSTAITGVVPRWVLPATARPRFNTSSSVQNLSVRVLLVDTEAEERLGLGRAWPYRPLGRGEAHVQGNVLQSLHIRPNRGDRIVIEFDVGRVLDEQGVTDVTLPVALSGEQGRQLLEDIALAPLGLNANSTVRIISGDLATALNVTLPTAFQNLTADVNVGEFLDVVAGQNFNTILSTFFFRNLLRPQLEFHVVDRVVSPVGKYPAALGNVILVDYREVLPHLLDSVCYRQITSVSAAVPSTEEVVAEAPLADYAILEVAMIRGRVDLYLSDRRPRAIKMIKATNDMMGDLGVRYNATFTWPIALALDSVYFFQLFLNQIFYSSVFIISILAFLVVYILQVTTAEERSYENGMLRAMGLSTTALMQLLLSQGLSFAVPAVAVALLLAYMANAIAEGSLGSLTQLAPRYNTIPPYTLILPAVVGIVIPILSNIIPVRSALSKSLRESLDRYHVTANETFVAVTKLEDLGIAPWQTILGIMLVLGGFMVYYLVPFAFIFDELFLFFMIMIIILLGMLIGLCMISQAFQPFLERYTILMLIPGWGVSPDLVLRHVVLKNLNAHRVRNQLSYLMFTMSVASIVFGGVTFALMDSTIRQNTEMFLGADVSVVSLNKDQPLDRARLEPVLESLQREGAVAEFAFQTFALDQHPDVYTTSVSNLVNYPTAKIKVYAVDRSFQRATFPEYFLTTNVEAGYLGTDLIASLYTSAAGGSGVTPPPKLYTGLVNQTNGKKKEPEINEKYAWTLACIMSSATRDFLSLSTDTYGLLTYAKTEEIYPENITSTLEQTFVFRPRAQAYKIPGFFVSSYPFGVANSPFLITNGNFRRMLPANGTALYSHLFVKIAAGTPQDVRLDAVNRISTFINADFHSIQDIRDVLESTKIATSLLNIFLYFLTGVSMILDTIMLWLAFITNVKMNSWSLAVLRSLGLTVKQMYRVFIYEALCLVLSSFVVGLIVGTLVATTLALQFNLFTELPLLFAFPWPLVLAVLILCVVSSVVASIIPTRQLVRRQIAQVLKSG